jgi:hypothetical protein
MPDMEKIDDYILEDDHKVQQEEIGDMIIEPKIGIFHMLYRFFSSLFISKHKVGELNGRWAALFKITLVLIILGVPTFFAWATWITNETFASKYHRIQTENFEDRINCLEKDVQVLSRIDLELAKISTKIENLPPPDWRRRIELLEISQNDEQKRLLENNKENQDQHSRILILLEGLKTTVEVLKENK